VKLREKPNISQQKAELRSLRVLGNLSGTCGDIVCRLYPKKDKYGRIHYQQRFATRPAHYRVNNRKDMVENRSRFRVVNTFAGFINKIPELKEIWRKYADKKGFFSAYTAITKANMPVTPYNSPGEFNMIIPPAKSYNFISPADMEISENEIKISNLPEGKLITVISLIDPKTSKTAKFKLFNFNCEVGVDGIGNLITGTEFTAQLKNYKNYIIYLTAVNEKKVSAYFSVKVKIKLKSKTIKAEKAPEVKLFSLYPVVKINQDQVSHSPPLAAPLIMQAVNWYW
jgi:hypothetical protein